MGRKVAGEHLPQLEASTLEDFSPAGQRSTLSTSSAVLGPSCPVHRAVYSCYLPLTMHPTRQRHAYLCPGSYIATVGGLCLGSCSTSRPASPSPKVPPPSTPTGPKQQKTPFRPRFFGPDARRVTRAEAREPRLPPEAVARTPRRGFLCPAPAVNIPASCHVLQPKPHEYGRLTCRRDSRPIQSPCRRETLDLQSLDGLIGGQSRTRNRAAPGPYRRLWYAVLHCAALLCSVSFAMYHVAPDSRTLPIQQQMQKHPGGRPGRT
jgi:hypothetical protein